MAVCVAVLCIFVKYMRQVPWHAILFFVAVVLGIALGAGYFGLQTFQGELGKDSNFSTFIGQVIDNHFYHQGMFTYKKPVTIDFFLNCLFLAVITMIESAATIRLAMFLTKQKFRASVELYSIGVTNMLAGFLGLLPVCLPISRNIMSLGCGAKSRVYSLYCLILAVLFTWIFWSVFMALPVIIKSIFSISIGISLIDIGLLRNHFKSHPTYSLMSLGFIFLTFFFELTFCIFFCYVIFFALYARNGSSHGYSVGTVEDLQTKVEFFNYQTQLD